MEADPPDVGGHVGEDVEEAVGAAVRPVVFPHGDPHGGHPDLLEPAPVVLVHGRPAAVAEAGPAVANPPRTDVPTSAQGQLKVDHKGIELAWWRTDCAAAVASI